MDRSTCLDEYGPEAGPDQRAERMLGALVCAVVGLLLALIVIVFVRGLAVVRPQRPRLVRRGRQRRRAAQTIYLSGQSGAELRLHVPRLAADLEHDADHRRRGR